MIMSLYTDRERILPLIHSKEQIIKETKLKIGDVCNTSDFNINQDESLRTKTYSNFFNKILS
jgi:hypothetical protein